MIRNTFYNRKTSQIHHWWYDEQGNPKEEQLYFKPYLYVPAPNPEKKQDALGIDDIPLIKKSFPNEWERTNFLKIHKGKVYFNLPASQQYLLERYYTKDIKETTQSPLRIFYYDIEVIADEFPDPIDAKFPLTSITVYDTFQKKYFVWGVKTYDDYSCKDHLRGIEPEDIVYDYCLTERFLLAKFLKFWRRNWPDLLVGYNSFSFDLPYIVHRIEKVLGEGKSSMLSKVGYIHGHEKENQYGQTYKDYSIGGVSHLDYMVLYKSFTPGERESDSLEFVCQLELGVGKLDHGNMSLQDLCATDWNRFINYNIWDVRLLVMLEDKRRYLEVAKFSAFSGFCNMDKALGKVAIITGIIAKQGLLKDRIISSQSEGTYQKIPGGFVKDPEPGMYENVVVMDLNSLYPNTIITLNISPETKVAKIIKENADTLTLYIFSKNTTVDVPRERFRQILVDKNWCLSAAGIIFNQNKKGLCSEFVDELYQKRKSVKNRMLGLETELTKMEKSDPRYAPMKMIASQLDTEQYLYKILLNSTYGVLANRFFALYDLDCGKSITLTGQALIQESDRVANAYISKEWDLPEKDRVPAGDTDSIILSIDDILIKLNATIVDARGDLTPEFIDIETRISENLNQGVQDWAKRMWNTNDCRFEFKRESACPRAIWVAKKHYIMHIRNSEGVKMDKLKYKGLSVVKSTYSNETKQITKDIVRGIFESPDKKKADAVFFKAYETFFQLPVQKVSTRSSIKALKKWIRSGADFKTESGCPQHAKYSIYYNTLLKKLNLQNKYPAIEEGKKIKLVSVKPNAYNIEGIAYLDELPSEFGLVPDHETMFRKTVVSCLEPIFDALKWHVPDPKKQHEIRLEDIFA